jgi:hypothetical protein
MGCPAVLRKERADRERRLEDLAVAVLTAIGERDGAVWDAERRAGEALRTMTGDEGLSVRAVAEWCGNALTMREVTRLRRLVPDSPAAPAERLTCQCGRPGCLARSWRTQRRWLRVSYFNRLAVVDANGVDVNRGGGEARHKGRLSPSWCSLSPEAVTVCRSTMNSWNAGRGSDTSAVQDHGAESDNFGQACRRDLCVAGRGRQFHRRSHGLGRICSISGNQASPQETAQVETDPRQ